MYRGTDAERLAAAVVEAAEKRDAGAVAAARELWLATEELPAGSPDHWEEKAWYALAGAGLLFDAVRAGVELIREGRRLRLAAFVHVVQHVGGAFVVKDDYELRRTEPRDVSGAESELLLEILDIVRKAGYPDDGYSAAVLMRFLEGKGKRFVWQYLEQHEAELSRSPAGWQLLGLIKQAFGDETALAAWWSRWPAYPGAEMWSAVMHLVNLRDQYGRGDAEALAAHSQAALDRLVPDESQRLIICVHLES
ncbi:MAG TPA: hypothetical protein VL172_18625, partial [Kofleriaceae bacterium]|nr:hypothetical protein [Kofleriaceae bacterium]